MTKKIVTAVCALALGLAWTMAPAIAADESMKDKAKDKMDTAKDKVGNAWDKTKEKTGEIKDKIKEKVTGKKGDDDVTKAQQALTDKGFNPGPIDGKMGPKTKAAITAFQTKESLKVTGRLDKETKDKLMTASATSKTDTTTPAASPSTTTAPSATPGETPKK
jgi:peptidoglycan hydrolase-like protein with peptidoglycan-binding domain